MKKRNLALMTAILAAALTACGGSNASNDTKAAGSDAAKEAGSEAGGEKAASTGKELRLVNGKIEVDAQMKELAAEYEEGDRSKG